MGIITGVFTPLFKALGCVLMKEEDHKALVTEAREDGESSAKEKVLRNINFELHRLVMYSGILKEEDCKVPEKYKEAFGVLYQSELPVYSDRADFLIGRLEAQGFPLYMAERLVHWRQEYPEYLVLLLFALAAGDDEPRAWGFAQNI